MAGTAMLRALVLGCAVVVGAGCGGSGSATSQPNEPRPTTTTTLAGMPCSLSAHDCTSAQVIATMTTLAERSGATPTEATCIAGIVGRGATSMSDAFRAGSSTEDHEVAACVLSNARQLKLGEKLQAIVTQIDPQFARSVYRAQDCKSSSSVGVAPISGTPGSPPSDWETMTPEQLRNAGWRKVVETSPSTCEPAQ